MAFSHNVHPKQHFTLLQNHMFAASYKLGLAFANGAPAG